MIKLSNTTLKTQNSVNLTEASVGIGARIKRFYIRHACKDFNDSKEVEKTLEHCEEILKEGSNANILAEKYGSLDRFSIKNAENCLNNSAPFSYNVKVKPEDLTSLDKLALTAMRFVDNFFDDEKNAKQENAVLYPAVINKIIEDFNISLNKDKEEEKIQFLKLIEHDLVLKFNLFLANDKEHNLSSITALTDLTSPSKCKRFFLNILLADKKNIKNYVTSPYRNSISSMYNQLSEIPNMEKKVNPFFKNIKNYCIDNFDMFKKNKKGEPVLDENGKKQASSDVSKIISSITGMQASKGIPDWNSLEMFLDKTIEYCKTELNITDKDGITKLLGSITNMQHNKGIPEFDIDDKENDLSGFLWTIKNFCKKELNTTNENKIAKILSSITGMQASKGIPNLVDLKIFLDKTIKYCEKKDKFNIHDKNQIANILSSITGMQAGKGIPNWNSLEMFLDKTIEYCKTELNTTDKDKITNFLSSITGMQKGKGIPEFNIDDKENGLGGFLWTIKNFCKEKLNITNENEIAKILSSITSMQTIKGIPNLIDLKIFLDKTIEYCKTELNITDKNEITKILSSITGMQASKGIPNWNNLKMFLDKTIKYCEKKDKFNIHDKNQIANILSSITSMQTGKGIPNWNSLEKFLDKTIKYCKTELNITDKDGIAKFLSSITGMQHSKGIPEFNIDDKENGLGGFLWTIKNFCKEKLNIINGNKIAKILSSITSMQTIKGIPNLDNLEMFLDKTIEYCKTVFNITDEDEITKILSSITCMQTSNGIPNLDNLENFFKNIKELCKTKLNINDKKGIIDTISKVGGRFFADKIPNLQKLEKLFDEIKSIPQEQRNYHWQNNRKKLLNEEN